MILSEMMRYGLHMIAIGIFCLLTASGSTVLETAELQRQIDRAAADGGGRVCVPAGRHLVGQLDLRSNVELHLEKGAVLEGAPGIENYRVTELPYSEGTWSAVVFALGVTNVAITGEGEIYGNGTAWPQPGSSGGNQEGLRARGLFFGNSKGIRLRDFSFRDSASWGIVFKCCEDVDIRRLRIDNHANYNNDGIDLEARNVVVADCDIDSGDDCVCLKSNNPGFVVENVLVTNVVGRSHCCVFKLGTASHGTMRNVRFVDCRTEGPRRDYIDRRFGRNRRWFENDDRPMSKLGYDWRQGGAATAALCVECVDGGTVEDILFRGIDIKGVSAPIFVRGGTRSGRSCGTPPSDRHILRNVLFENITAEARSFVPSSVTGVEGCRAKNVILRNVRLLCKGAGERSAAARTTPVPELAGGYPDAHMFEMILPAWGLYARHVDGLRLENVRFDLLPGTEDARERIVLDDVTDAATGHAAGITWRIHTDMWRSDANFEALVAFLKRHRVTGRLALFTSGGHAPPRLPFMYDLAKTAAKRLAVLRDLGYEAGINNLCTLGHNDESAELAAEVEGATFFTAGNGKIARCVHCPNDPVWRERYVKPLYEALARTGADFIWLDDDIRMEQWRLGTGCFCPVCLAKIAAYFGMKTVPTVADLSAFFADPAEGMSRRRRFLAWKRESLGGFVRYVTEVVRSVAPQTVIGIMDHPNYDAAPFAEKFRGAGGPAHPVYWRPGGGLYRDQHPDDLLNKLNSIAFECAYLPKGVAAVEAEIEDYDYQRLDKSTAFHLLETKAMCAVCTRGAAYNVLVPMAFEDLESSSGELVDALEGLRPELDRIVRLADGAPCRGIWCGRGPDWTVASNRGADWLTGPERGWTPPAWNSQLQMLGLPMAYRPEDAQVFCLDVRAVEAMTDAELSEAFGRGVFLDAEAAEAAARRGFGEDIGFDVGEPLAVQCAERYLEHPLNTGFAGRARSLGQAFWGGVVRGLRPHAGATPVAAGASAGKIVAPCVAGVFENRRGGRVYVAGAHPYTQLHYRHKAEQMKNVFRWLSKDSLPGYVAGYRRAALWVRGDRMAVVANLSLDTVEDLELALADGEGGYTRRSVPRMLPWSVAVVDLRTR